MQTYNSSTRQRGNNWIPSKHRRQDMCWFDYDGSSDENRRTRSRSRGRRQHYEKETFITTARAKSRGRSRPITEMHEGKLYTVTTEPIAGYHSRTRSRTRGISHGRYSRSPSKSRGTGLDEIKIYQIEERTVTKSHRSKSRRRKRKHRRHHSRHSSKPPLQSRQWGQSPIFIEGGYPGEYSEGRSYPPYAIAVPDPPEVHIAHAIPPPYSIPPPPAAYVSTPYNPISPEGVHLVQTTGPGEQRATYHHSGTPRAGHFVEPPKLKQSKSAYTMRGALKEDADSKLPEVTNRVYIPPNEPGQNLYIPRSPPLPQRRYSHDTNLPYSLTPSEVDDDEPYTPPTRYWGTEHIRTDGQGHKPFKMRYGGIHTYRPKSPMRMRTPRATSPYARGRESGSESSSDSESDDESIINRRRRCRERSRHSSRRRSKSRSASRERDRESDRVREMVRDMRGILKGM